MYLPSKMDAPHRERLFLAKSNNRASNKKEMRSNGRIGTAIGIVDIQESEDRARFASTPRNNISSFPTARFQSPWRIPCIGGLPASAVGQQDCDLCRRML
jgi:hypothetical protein